MTKWRLFTLPISGIKQGGTMKPTEQMIKDKCQEWDGMENGQSACLDGIEWALSQMEPEWVAVTERLPEVGVPVIVETEYRNCGIPVEDCFMGYMDEYGDLIVHPTDEDYGWQFNDCVTRWKPQPPTKP